MVNKGLLKTSELGEYLQVSPRTLIRWRNSRQGPPWVKAGHKVMYRISDVEAWLVSRRQVPGRDSGYLESAAEIGKEAPPELADAQNIERLGLPESRTGIYFLVKSGKIVYVGQSIDSSRRVSQHSGEKSFDDVYFVRVSKDHLSAVESGLIKALKPYLNSERTRNGQVADHEVSAMKKYGLESLTPYSALKGARCSAH